jgi:hypothetical protein
VKTKVKRRETHTILRSRLLKLGLILAIMLDLAYAVIIPTYSVNSSTMDTLLEEVGENSLVLINVDDTIITPKSLMFRYNSPYRTFIGELESLQQVQPNMRELIAALILQRQVMLIESDWPRFINKLKSKGALVFGFTRLNTVAASIKDYEEWQYKQLESLAIKFTGEINKQEIFKFDGKNKESPIFYKGIIFTTDLSKEETLRQFLSITRIAPRNIIVFEYRKSNLNNIDKFFRTIDLDCFGIEYLGFEELQGTPDDKLVEFQKETLLRDGKWLEDDEAKKLLKSSAILQGN